MLRSGICFRGIGKLNNSQVNDSHSSACKNLPYELKSKRYCKKSQEKALIIRTRFCFCFLKELGNERKYKITRYFSEENESKVSYGQKLR